MKKLLTVEEVAGALEVTKWDIMHYINSTSECEYTVKEINETGIDKAFFWCIKSMIQCEAKEVDEDELYPGEDAITYE